MATTQVMQSLLTEYSMDKYYIRFSDSNFANHIAHAIVSLGYLGASEDRIRRAVIAEAAAQRPATYGARDSTARLKYKDESPSVCYYDYVNFYRQKLATYYSGDVNALISAEFPKLVRTMHADAFHGLIQMGYGIVVESAETVIEGLAWIHYADETNIKLSRDELAIPVGQGNFAPGDVLEVLRSDPEVISIGIRVPGSPFKRYINKTTEGHRVHILQDYADKMNFGKGHANQPLQLANDLVHLAIQVYAMAKVPNDYFLLHGVTASWSLKKVVERMADPKDQLGALRVMTLYLLGTYIAQDCPRLKPERVTGASVQSWDQIVENTLKADHEIHIFKLVQVCKEMATELPQNDALYRYAAQSSMETDLVSLGKRVNRFASFQVK